ncbi:MAG: restriction endonuclease subunit S, partial [Thermoplasmatales archaeon]|nr:restriction endonuclease subunit S [Thermoplasmatales archaeon]
MNQQTRFKQTEIGKIPEDWEVKSLKLICDKITDGSHFSPKEDSQGNYKIATVKDMTFLGFDLNSCKKISEEDYNTLVKTGCKVEKGHVLFSKDGTMGIVYVPKVSLDLVLLSSIAILKPKKEIIPEFLGYYLKGKKTQWIIQSSYASGSALPRIVLKDLKKLPVVIPPNTEQKSISKILSDLDSKIELNHQMNKTLEAIAQALFKHWF